MRSEKKRKERFFSDLLYAICHQYFHPEIAQNLWKEILQHKLKISNILKRNVRVIVATLDYLSNLNGDFPSPTLIGENHIFEIVAVSMRDGMTGLFNHTSCHEILDLELKSCRRYGQTVSLIILDIDNFKMVNDQFGHPEGDRVLKEVADAIERESRASDICCRYGGEEFVIILPFTDSETTSEVAERIRTKSMRSLPGGYTLTVSLGVASCDESITSAFALIEKADRALYRAKENGKNQVAVG